jgi:hypothetical protein
MWENISASLRENILKACGAENDAVLTEKAQIIGIEPFASVLFVE